MTAQRPSIVQFLTDGSLPRLCADLGALARVRITLHDETGCEIIAGEGEVPFAIAQNPSPLDDNTLLSLIHI